MNRKMASVGNNQLRFLIIPQLRGLNADLAAVGVLVRMVKMQQRSNAGFFYLDFSAEEKIYISKIYICRRYVFR